MAKIDQLPTRCDLSQGTFAEACGRLGEMPRDVRLVCATASAATAQHIQEQFGCAVAMIPTEMLKSQFAWGATHDRDWVWSPGIE